MGDMGAAERFLPPHLGSPGDCDRNDFGKVLGLFCRGRDARFQRPLKLVPWCKQIMAAREATNANVGAEPLHAPGRPAAGVRLA